jgi:sterol desaturase/sphingolipid hydroxylase (fatty acid hydroxylase superfamily)
MKEKTMTSQLDVLDLAATILGSALFVLLPIELWQRYRHGKLTRQSILEMLASLSPVLPTILFGGVVTAFILWLFGAAAKIAPWQLPVNVLTIAAAIILVDFTYYWDHRLGHRVRVYWAISHSVHHSSPQFDQTTALRISFVDGFLSPWFYTPVILIGFDPFLVAAAFGFNLAYQQWIHTEAIGKLGLFDMIFNSPANHRVHHGAQEKYLDKNYGGIFMVWDHLFGSYQAEEEAVRFGLTTPINSINPLTVHIIEATRMMRDIAAQPSWQKRLKILFMPPGYS